MCPAARNSPARQHSRGRARAAGGHDKPARRGPRNPVPYFPLQQPTSTLVTLGCCELQGRHRGAQLATVGAACHPPALLTFAPSGQ